MPNKKYCPPGNFGLVENPDDRYSKNSLIAKLQCQWQYGYSCCTLHEEKVMKQITVPVKHWKWYSEAMDRLQPLRSRLYEIIEEIESHNRFLAALKKHPIKARVSVAKITAAKRALAKAERFFTKGI
jgi:hypothetical protein